LQTQVAILPTLSDSLLTAPHRLQLRFVHRDPAV